jgi:ADP-ribose pyrophosphatase
VLGLCRFGTRQRRDRPGDAGDAGPSAARERQPLDGPVEHRTGFLSSPSSGAGQSDTRGRDALPHSRRALARAGGELVRPASRQRKHEVEPVEERAGHLVAERRQPLGRTGALRAGVAASAARAEVHRSDELKPGRKHRSSLGPRHAYDAVFEWLPEGLEHVPAELGELVEEEDAAVSERRLAGARVRAAADDRLRRRAVVRRAERPHVHERPAGRQKSGDRLDTRHFDRLLGRERREDAREAAREHRLPGPGRTGEQEIVSTRCRELERAAGTLLPAHLREVGVSRCRRRTVGLVRRRLVLAAKVGDGLGEMTQRHRIDAGERRLRRRLGRAQDSVEAGFARRLGRDEHAVDGTQPAVERQLADGRESLEAVARKLVRGSEDRQRDRQVEARALLLQGGRREVDDDAPPRPYELGGLDATLDALLRLLAGAIGQSDDREAGDAALEVRLHFDTAGLEPEERMRDRSREHSPTLVGEDARTRAESVETLRVHWRKLGERIVYERFRRVVSRTFELPSGETVDFEILDGNDTVAVLALTEDDLVILVREFRAGPEEFVVELPGGLIESGQTPVEAARAELLEETGYEGELAEAGTMLDDAYSTWRKHAFTATSCRRVSEPAEGELTEPVLMSLDEFRAHLRAGRLTDVDVGYRALDQLGLL